MLKNNSEMSDAIHDFLIKSEIIVSLEEGNKKTEEEAYKELKKIWKELKKIHKKNKMKEAASEEN